MSSGVNLEPGSNDDGWIVPPPVRLSDGTQLQLYKDGEALHAAYQAIRGAQSRVFLEVYIFADDATGHAFAELLAEKARQGLRVYVIYDSFGSRGAFGRLPEHLRMMQGAGVRLEQFHPLRPWECSYSWRPVNRDHRKLLLVDNDAAGIGGLNVGAEYGGSWVVPPEPGAHCEFWRDNAVGIRGPGSRKFMKAFAHSWQYVRRGGRFAKLQFQEDLLQGELGILASVPTMNSALRPALHRLLREARESVELTMAYFAPDDDLVGALCRAARRGVRVRLMLPGRCDVPTVRVAAQSFYETMMNCGIEVYERQGVILHAKTMVIDQSTSVIGSTNLDYRSIEYNCEISAIIRSAEFGKQVHDLFENDVNFAERIDPKAWRRRPWQDRLIQWAVSRARYLL
jgi:cardiolipin synthase